MNWFNDNKVDKAEPDTELLSGEEYSAGEDNDESPESDADRYGFAELLTVSAAPHLKSSITTRSIMMDVFFALIPAFVWGIIVFGTRALALGITSVAACVLFEFLFQKILGREKTVGDFSAAVTGLLLAMNLSPAVPYWIPVIGAFFAIVVVKGLFGGLGKNIVNPALAARVFLFAWPAEMNAFPALGTRVGTLADTADVIASATPLTQIKQTGSCDASVFDLIIGNVGGCIGEVSALFLIFGGIYLLLRRVITWHTPAAYIGCVAAIALLFPRINGDPLNSMLTEMFSGGVIICALFMATDYVTTPVTPLGKIIFGAGCGIITMLIRYFGGFSEGASFSVLIMNLLVWYIDKLTMPKPYGGKKYVKEK